ncbi:hypothetical protein LPJ53_005309 [Coemansia erecta]|uniref:Alpha/beta hydrolase fold-3 domain-containing protein n=1 Tax=Coemansia erecta TaxID=147472 RepID=A0A9W7XX58_9FUNG|nr:hypothetical protein LPJ53_005309 [Coemansia erecta]
MADPILRIPGVSNDEFTPEEDEYALQMARQIDLAAFIEQPATNSSPAYDVPASTGTLCVATFAMPPDQPAYNLADGSVAQHRLEKIYASDSQVAEPLHSMVIACAASLEIPDKDRLGESPALADERIILYVCGGGFITCDTPPDRLMYLRLSAELGQRVFAPRYHVAPAHRFPQPVHDVYTAYQHVLRLGFQPSNVALMGVSAGGNIALALLHLLRIQDETHLMPRACVLLAPCPDLTMAADSLQRNSDRCVLPTRPFDSPESLPRLYYGPEDGIDEAVRHPLMSPARGCLAGLPPVLALIGSHDVFVDDATALFDGIVAAGGSASLVVYPKRNHYSFLRGPAQLRDVYGRMRQFLSD